MKDLEKVEVKSRAEWRAWLRKNYRQSESIWLVSYKKACGEKYVPYGDLVEEALCFGWIDSHTARLDEERSMLLMAPRKAGSVWSKLNKDRVERLIAAKLMTKAGLAKIERAKADGSWSALDEVEALIVPEDLAAALAADLLAEKNFLAFSRSWRKLILYWISSAKRAETRQARIAATVAKARLNLNAAMPVTPRAGS